VVFSDLDSPFGYECGRAVKPRSRETVIQAMATQKSSSCLSVLAGVWSADGVKTNRQSALEERLGLDYKF
jgi:hypothetical protein